MRNDKAGAQPKADRKARLAEQLRANLQKRKAQTRARRRGDADGRPEGIAAAEKAAK
jgi:hypothetical protein